MAIPFVESFMRKRSRVLQACIKVLEVMLLSTGLISTLLMLKGALFMPYPCELVFSSLLEFWNSVRCFLSSPLYICIIINSIVLLVKLSSTFHHRVRIVPNNRDHVANIQTGVLPPPQSLSPSPPPRMVDMSTKIVTIKELQETSHTDSPNILRRHIKQDGLEKPNEELIPQANKIKKTISQPQPQSLSPSPPPRLATTYPKDMSKKIVTIKELQKISHANSPNILHRNIKQDGLEKPNEELIPQVNKIKKTISQLNPKPNLQEPLNVEMERKTYPSKRGKALTVEVTNDDEGDSMEATWKAIMGGGKQRPKKRPLKKSETWDVPTNPRTVPIERLDSEVVVPSSPIWREMRNAESFNDAMSMTRRGGLIRRDSSMSLEDFNNKVEGFIKKLKWKSKASTSNAR